MDIDDNDFLAHLPLHYIDKSFSIFYFDVSFLYENGNIRSAIDIFMNIYETSDTKTSNTLSH